MQKDSSSAFKNYTGNSAEMTILKKNIQDFSSFKSGENWTPAVAEALRSEKEGIFFPEGAYHFYPEGAETRYVYVTNNDEGLKKLIFHVEDRDGFTLEGDHAEFIFHGRVVPFRFFRVLNLRLSGITIDFAIPSMVEADVESCDDSSITLRFPKERPYWILDGKICFINDDFKFMKDSFPWEVFDTVRRERMEGRESGLVDITVQEIAPGLVRFPNRYGKAFPGERIVMKPEARLTPGIVLDACRQVAIRDLTIHSASGMGVVAQNSFDIALEQVRVGGRPGSGRSVSVSDDAVHFANCGGRIVLRNCCFENQWDDAVNIHGVYRSYIPRENKVHFLRAGHYQQFGVPFAEVGEHLLIDGRCYTVSFLEDGKQYAWFDTAEPIPEDTPFAAPVLNLDRQPDVLIRDCVFRGNQPRGVLCSSGGHAVIENNVFHTPGAAIYVAGDSSYWFEAGPVNDMLIRNNLFDNCFYLGCSGAAQAVIAFHPSMDMLDSFYHRHIRILDNEFKDSHGRMLKASWTDDLVFAGNRWIKDDTYHSQKPGKAIELSNCGEITLTNNILPQESRFPLCDVEF